MECEHYLLNLTIGSTIFTYEVGGGSLKTTKHRHTLCEKAFTFSPLRKQDRRKSDFFEKKKKKKKLNSMTTKKGRKKERKSRCKLDHQRVNVKTEKDCSFTSLAMFFSISYLRSRRQNLNQIPFLRHIFLKQCALENTAHGGHYVIRQFPWWF